MTRKEAIKHLRNDWFMSLGGQLCVDEDKKDAFLEAIGMGIKARRPVSREQVERIRGKWETTADAEEELKNFSCSSCGYLLCDVDTAVIMPVENDFYFCPNCGAPMTDEAMQMLMERLEKIYK